MLALNQTVTESAKRFLGIKSELAGVQEMQNAVGTHFNALEKEQQAATEAVFESKNAKELVENFDKLVAATMFRKQAMETLGLIHGSIGIAKASEITEDDATIETLRDCCVERVNELEKRIRQICDDSKELADRSGIDWSEPPAVATLRQEAQSARDAIEACTDKLNGKEIEGLWSKVSPLIKLNAARAK